VVQRSTAYVKILIRVIEEGTRVRPMAELEEAAVLVAVEVAEAEAVAVAAAAAAPSVAPGGDQHK